MEETPERPAWVLSEGEIVLVKIALGGDYAQSAFFDVLSGGAADLDTVRRNSTQINNALAACLSIEEDPKLQERARMIVLLRTRDLAAGHPVDYRMQALIAEWCRRQIKPAERGRPGSTIKKIAVQGALLELAHPAYRNHDWAGDLLPVAPATAYATEYAETAAARWAALQDSLRYAVLAVRARAMLIR